MANRGAGTALAERQFLQLDGFRWYWNTRLFPMNIEIEEVRVAVNSPIIDHIDAEIARVKALRKMCR